MQLLLETSVGPSPDRSHVNDDRFQTEIDSALVKATHGEHKTVAELLLFYGADPFQMELPICAFQTALRKNLDTLVQLFILATHERGLISTNQAQNFLMKTLSPGPMKTPFFEFDEIGKSFYEFITSASHDFRVSMSTAFMRNKEVRPTVIAETSNNVELATEIADVASVDIVESLPKIIFNLVPD